MLIKDNEHDRPLYYTGYIGSTCIERIQVDPESALSIIPKRLLYFLGILLHKLSAMTTTRYMALMLEVVTHWERFSFVVKLET